MDVFENGFQLEHIWRILWTHIFQSLVSKCLFQMTQIDKKNSGFGQPDDKFSEPWHVPVPRNLKLKFYFLSATWTILKMCILYLLIFSQAFSKIKHHKFRYLGPIPWANGTNQLCFARYKRMHISWLSLSNMQWNLFKM